MRKLKYQGGLTKMISSNLGKKNKIDFSTYINKYLYSVRHKLNNEQIQLAMVSFSSRNDFYEQILSILSFLRYVGTPKSWTIYSDGTHTKEQIQLLKSGFEFVDILITNWENEDRMGKRCKETLLPYINHLVTYAKLHPLGKKLFLYLNHEIKESTLFLDSDIMFYKQAPILNILLKEEVNGWYLPDADWECLDSHYKAKNEKQLYQVNSGFLLFCKDLTNLKEGLEFLRCLNFRYEYFSEQTVMHILSKANGFMPLDPRIFILNNEDQFDFSYLRPREKMAIRHYTGPVRHKMWQKDWRWQLSLSKTV